MDRRAFVAACSGMMVAACAAAHEDKWPSRPIDMIVGGAPGSGLDNFARIICSLVSSYLKQDFVIYNKPGANGIISIQSLLQDKPDGYSMLFTNASAIVVNEALGRKLPYKLSDLAPIAQLSSGGVLLVAAATTGVKTLPQFIQYMKAHPGQSYGTWGIGSTGHIVMEWLAKRAGFSVRHIPYKSLSQILIDIKGGVLDFAFTDSRSPLPYVKAGAIFPIAVSGSRRVLAFPQTPTLTEVGYPMEADGWYGVFAGAGTPSHVLSAMNAACLKALQTKKAENMLERQFISPPPHMTPSEFGNSIQRDLRIWASTVNVAGIKLQ